MHRLSRGAFSLAHVYGTRISSFFFFSLLLFLSFLVVLFVLHAVAIFPLARSLACAIGLHIEGAGERTGDTGEKATEVVEFGSRRSGGRTAEEGRERDEGIARIEQREKRGARQGPTGGRAVA